MSTFYDAHVHIMNFDYVNFTPLLYSVFESGASSLTSGFFSSSYINPQTGKLTNNFANTLSRFQEPIKSTIFCMEEDLKGHLGHKNAFIKEDGKFHFRNKTYDNYAIVPLCMDFSSSPNNRPYYNIPYRDKITYFATKTLEQIEIYKSENPNTIFKFYPFLGINPEVHTKEKILQLLQKFFKGKEEEHFYGIKFYPPLGTDPWPIEDKEKWEKVELIYNFAEENNIPLTTHCDNQGFRVIETKDAWKFTDPLSWKYVIENHKGLRVNFAHFGRFYSNTTRLLDKVASLSTNAELGISHSEWMKTIIEFIEKYDNVYTDLSFSLMDKTFVNALSTFLLKIGARKEKLYSRIIFGSDFSINLLKIDSYNSYLKNYENSPFTDEMVFKTVETTAENFLGFTK